MSNVTITTTAPPHSCPQCGLTTGMLSVSLDDDIDGLCLSCGNVGHHVPIPLFTSIARFARRAKVEELRVVVMLGIGMTHRYRMSDADAALAELATMALEGKSK